MPSKISIHALLAESDVNEIAYQRQINQFLSTLSLRRATWLRCWQLAARDISIHALLAESDCLYRLSLITLPISIHALLAESDGGSGVGSWPRVIFLSTLSLRRATVKLFRQNYECFISIHALLAESDADKHVQQPTQQDFYPRSPCGERLCVFWMALNRQLFLSTLSLRRATPL